ncbi:MAG: DUF2219 family protein [Hyphomonadaceae bacterium]|nr:DUF2219 family protein [Hyphomonadaceae bacterium]
MIASLASSLFAASCLGCATPPTDSEAIVLKVGPVDGPQSFTDQGPHRDIIFSQPTQPETGLPLRVGNDFSPTNMSSPLTAARFEALDLATPQPIRSMTGENWGGEVSFGASAKSTGLGLDLSFVPRAQLQQDRAGNNVARTGAEVRVGENLVDRDLRGTGASAPSWYFFVGADNEALVWNVADKKALDGASLRDQATVGDLQAGVAFSTGQGAQMSFGLVERKLEFNDIAGDQDVNMRERFAAFSYTLHH